MGVTGTGKTTVGQALAKATGWLFADADDFHSSANRAKMHAGIPLTDEDRAPWLESLHTQIQQWSSAHANVILACSALKESYRVTLARDIPPDVIRLVYLTGPVSLIEQRLQARTGHYMPASMLQSQIDALEPPQNALQVSIEPPVSTIVQQIVQSLGLTTMLEPAAPAEKPPTERSSS
ncbi:MAG: gluconokinase [Acidobacteriales bacterium]|nr:gluconokinase [Terriglobales bacterium]